jgi:MFS family permease
MNVGSFFGRWIPGFYADKIGRYNTIILSVTLNIIAVLCIWLPAGNTTAGFVMFALLFGFASGSNVSLTPVCISQLCPIAGEILAHNGGQYWGLMVFVGACYIGALAALVTTRMQSKGWKLGIIY